ncbi:MAG: MotA/TolQ/ExbB proton channel family protein [Gemmataceae bacterium]|nr:MotA/TolQ/ExbB proton channel family protein [Gemmata sp.]MDW8197194.1 MotA/TolQ/ExbB proton channel family protein [Gemmataceae bacterium]
MSISTSHRPAREWLLLVLALILVGGAITPVWQLLGGPQMREELARKWTDERLLRLFIGPEQVLCYLCAVWAGLILQSRYREVLRQRRAFTMDLLPTEEGARILPEDARPLNRKIEQITAGQPLILANMVRLGLGKFAISKSAPDVAEVVRNQADVELSRLIATMATVNYLAWAIPAIGFVGTVRGLGGAFGVRESDILKFTDQAKDQLNIAFDCTLVALVLSLIVMYFLHMVQRAEETLITDAQQYCQEHLLLRLYDPAKDGGI